MIFGINTTSDVSKLLYVISLSYRLVKFLTILKYHEWYLCKISRTNHAIICLYYYPQKVCNFHMYVFQIKLKYNCSKPIKLQKFLMWYYNYSNCWSANLSVPDPFVWVMLMVNPGVLIVLRGIRAIFVKGKNFKVICGKLLVCISATHST